MLQSGTELLNPLSNNNVIVDSVRPDTRGGIVTEMYAPGVVARERISGFEFDDLTSRHSSKTTW